MNAHPLALFHYCPRCGAADFKEHDGRSKRCGACGFVYYLNPSASVACFIRDAKGDLLVVRRRCEPAKGTLDLPGGFAELDETFEEALQREVCEETGLTLRSFRYLFSCPNRYIYSDFTVHTLDSFFEGEVDSFDEVEVADDAAEALILALEKAIQSMHGEI